MPGNMLSVQSWVLDAERPECTECRREFTVFTRRHHCRRCGEVFCAGCSKYRSAAIPGLPRGVQDNGAKLRVCRSCYFRHLAYLVVRMAPIGPRFELFGSQAEALKYFRECRTNCLVMAMNTGRIMERTQETERIGHRLQMKAVGVRNQLFGGYEPAQQLPTHADDSSRVSLTGTPIARRVRGGANTLVFAACVRGTWRFRCLDVRGGDKRAQTVSQFLELCSTFGDASKGVVFTLRDLTAVNTYTSGLLSRTAQVVVEAENFIRSLDWVLVSHVGGHCSARVLPSLSTALEALDRMPLECSAVLMDTNHDVAATHRCDTSAASFLEELKYCSGEAVLRETLRVSAVAVVSPRDVLRVTSNLHTAQLAARAEADATGAFASIVALPVSVLSTLIDRVRGIASPLMGSPNLPSPTVGFGTPAAAGAEQPAPPRTPVAAGTLPPAAVHRVPSAAGVASSRSASTGSVAARTPRDPEEVADSVSLDLLSFVALVAKDAPFGCIFMDPRPMLPEHRLRQAVRDILLDALEVLKAVGRHQGGQRSLLVTPPPPPDTQKIAFPECDICFQPFTAEGDRRPVMCPECANTICFSCWQQVPNCPMDRAAKPDKPRFNIALMNVIESLQDSAV